MGQTLTHGVYLPDEGERNCYSGLAGNWQILDTSVGTIAEHTSALSGKAPLVHTHVKSDITDFPAYGNAAGTICEGNDSRLSDARTPVAHTHTKSDVTDLLNSNFIPSANNSYNLGSSSYQWNNLYAKNYYYNGVAWGLDKANEWTNDNTYKGSNLNLQNNLKEIGSSSSQGHYTIRFKDKNGVDMGFISHQTTFLRFGLSNKFTNGVYDPSGTQINNYLNLYVNSDGTKSADIYSDFVPAITQRYNLGNSTFKWATFNGINPGALSLPDYNDPDPINFNQWSVPGNNNKYTPTEDGWLCVIMKDTATTSIFIYTSALSMAKQYAGSVYGNGTQGNGRLALMIPVRANVEYTIILRGESVSDIFAVRFYPCCGNV